MIIFGTIKPDHFPMGKKLLLLKVMPLLFLTLFFINGFARDSSTNFSAFYQILEPPITIVSSATIPICNGASTTLTASSTEDYTYTWSPAAGLSSTTGAEVIATPLTTTSYSVTGTSGDVITTTIITVFVNPIPTDIAVMQLPVSSGGISACDLDYVQLTALGGEIPTALPVTVFYEDFSAGLNLPSNWITTGTDERVFWSIYESGDAGGVPNELYLNAIDAEPDDFGEYAITTFAINTENFSSLHLSFKQFIFSYDSDLYPYDLKVQTSVNNIDWVDRAISVLPPNYSEAASELDFALTGIDHTEMVYLRFVLEGNPFGIFDWSIDDIVLSGVVSTPIIKWSPSIGLYTDAALTLPYSEGSNVNVVYAAPDTAQVYTARSSLGNCSKTAATNSIQRTKKIFTGLSATPLLWDVAENWSNHQIPSNDKCVIIPVGKKVVVNTALATAKKVTVNSGAKLTIDPYQTLTLTDELINSAAATDVVIASDGNLIQENSVVNVGSITVEKLFTFTDTEIEANNRRQYNYVISPVIGQNLKTIFGGSTKVITHNEAQNSFFNSDGVYLLGRGFAVKEPFKIEAPSTTETAKFVGAPYNGVFSYPLKYSQTQDDPGNRGFNLVGNPYPSNLDIQELYDGNSTKITSTFYFWDNRGNTQFTQQGSAYSGDHYAKYNAVSETGVAAGYAASGAPDDSKIPNQYVKAATGFIVQALSSATDLNLNFDNSMRTSNDGPAFFGKNKEVHEKDRFWLTLKTPSNLELMSAVVYLPKGNKNFGAEDTEVFEASDEIFTLANDHKLAIQGRGSFANTDSVPLGISVFQSGIHTISIYNKEGIFANGQAIYLKDQQTGTIANLTQGSYVFTANAGGNNTRFEIVYKPEIVLAANGIERERLVIYRHYSNFDIRSPKEIERVEVYDSSGKLLKVLQPNAKIATLKASTLNHGIYILKIKTNDGEIFNRKIVK